MLSSVLLRCTPIRIRQIFLHSLKNKIPQRSYEVLRLDNIAAGTLKFFVLMYLIFLNGQLVIQFQILILITRISSVCSAPFLWFVKNFSSSVFCSCIDRFCIDLISSLNRFLVIFFSPFVPY